MLLAAAAALAIVAQDQVALRNAPKRGAQQQAVLWAGDTLEVRGERLDYVQVWDHRRERGGYVAASQIRVVDLTPAAAPELLAVLRFLRDQPGSEALGIAYAAAYLKAAPASEIGAEPLVAIGVMADRLAVRASQRSGVPGDGKLAAQLEIAQAYGVGFESFTPPGRDGRMQLCYDGDALARAFALPAPDEQRAVAALALTRHECVDPNRNPLEVNALNAWRAKILDKVDDAPLTPLMRNRVRLRRAGVWSALAFADAREGRPPQEAGARALSELAGVVEGELAEDDRTAYAEAAVRVGASRWAAEGAAAPPGALHIATAPGTSPGETCVRLLDASHDTKAPLATRCTFATVWPASASANRNGTALALAVQPLATWRELWVFRKDKKGWSVHVVPPATELDAGYAEFAGWVPGKLQLLVAREARVGGRWQKSFEVVSLNSFGTLRRADKPEDLSAFWRWQSPAWKALTVSLR